MNNQTESVLFRQKLYQNFKDSGLLSKLQTTLRVNLLQKLKRPTSSNKQQQIIQEQQLRIQRQQREKPIHLRRKFLNCIVSEYLTKVKYQYTLAIFKPQSNMNQEDCLKYNQLAEIINLRTPQLNNNFLQNLVSEWFKIRAQSVKERSCQTDFQEPLAKKMDIIDKQYAPKIDYWKLIRPNSSSNTQSQFQIQQKLKQKFDEDKKRIREQLQISIKQQMNRKYENQYLFRMKQLQKNHEGRINEIKNRERQILDSLERKKNELQQRRKQLTDDQIKMIEKYENKIKEVELYYSKKIQELQNKQKEYWKKELQLKAKKKQYEDAIRLVKDKIIDTSSK